ncbi:hypothetical protein P280DRAFT_471000 [Massarina eburnea CBS 473.64]|uniref:Uncharacterized protein n=1 Tax=Massarina eburnea CBS 473.64 TaxID=1395130 RepID=A0A6A6RUZ7_9PLEO|nr:hypothetical protein P280DRAFT_471000 [Massarina eburnea CBS 473.64]
MRFRMWRPAAVASFSAPVARSTPPLNSPTPCRWPPMFPCLLYARLHPTDVFMPKAPESLRGCRSLRIGERAGSSLGTKVGCSARVASAAQPALPPSRPACCKRHEDAMPTPTP